MLGTDPALQQRRPSAQACRADLRPTKRSCCRHAGARHGTHPHDDAQACARTPPAATRMRGACARTTSAARAGDLCRAAGRTRPHAARPGARARARASLGGQAAYAPGAVGPLAQAAHGRQAVAVGERQAHLAHLLLRPRQLLRLPRARGAQRRAAPPMRLCDHARGPPFRQRRRDAQGCVTLRPPVCSHMCSH